MPDPGGPALERHWAGWRSDYITSAFAGDADPAASGGDEGEGSLFERILHSGLPDDQTFILWRGERTFAILNAYPYGSGHLMVLPQVAAPDLTDLDVDTSAELWAGVNLAVQAIRAAYDPDGVNVGINLGAGAGAGVPDHLHVHCMPRWQGDTNFITTIAETRVLPEPLAVSFEKLTAAWPA